MGFGLDDGGLGKDFELSQRISDEEIYRKCRDDKKRLQIENLRLQTIVNLRENKISKMDQLLKEIHSLSNNGINGHSMTSKIEFFKTIITRIDEYKKQESVKDGDMEWNQHF